MFQGGPGVLVERANLLPGRLDLLATMVKFTKVNDDVAPDAARHAPPRIVGQPRPIYSPDQVMSDYHGAIYSAKRAKPQAVSSPARSCCAKPLAVSRVSPARGFARPGRGRHYPRASFSVGEMLNTTSRRVISKRLLTRGVSPTSDSWQPPLRARDSNLTSEATPEESM